MSLDVSQIIQVTARISAAGLSQANFGSLMVFADFSEKPTSGVNDGDVNTYTSLSDLAAKYPDTTEVYKCASVWFATQPNPQKLQVYQMQDQDPNGDGTGTISTVTILNEAREKYWWYITAFNKSVYEAAVASSTDDFKDIVEWGEANSSMIPNCVSGDVLAEVLDSAEESDICSILKALGSRHCFSLASSSPYAAISLCAHFGSVNYSLQQAAISGEFKKLSTAADNFTATQYATLDDKQAVYYTPVDASGSTDTGRVINSITHSSYGEYIDNIFDLDAFINAIQVALYNALTSQVSKLPQTPAGQQILIGAANQVGENFINNGYLGERKYIDSVDGQEKISAGYEMLTQPEDILDLSSSDRSDRKSAPIKMALYPAGAVHKVQVTLDVY